MDITDLSHPDSEMYLKVQRLFPRAVLVARPGRHDITSHRYSIVFWKAEKVVVLDRIMTSLVVLMGMWLTGILFI